MTKLINIIFIIIHFLFFFILKAIHNKLMEEFGLPTWGSYLIFAIATIIFGAVIGLVIVCIIDFIYPPKPVKIPGNKKRKDDKDKTSDDEDYIESVKDDLVDEDGSDSEKHDENDKKSAANSPNARKRKPRKAD